VADADRVPRAVALVGAAWLLVAVVLGAVGVVRLLQPPAPPILLFGLTAVLLALAWCHPGVRAWLHALDARWLVAPHLTRYVGIYFLYLHDRGRLPYAFAVPGGWGDIVAASAAGVLLLSGRPRGGGRRAAYLAWSVFGLVDLLFVVLTAGRLGLEDPASMAELLELPLSLLPTFLVPVLIASHLVLGVRLLRRSPSGDL
jgi:hypothetical protein